MIVSNHYFLMWIHHYINTANVSCFRYMCGGSSRLLPCMHFRLLHQRVDKKGQKDSSIRLVKDRKKSSGIELQYT